MLQKIINSLNGLLWESNLLVVMLLGCGLYFSIKSRFMQFRLFKHIISLLMEKNNDSKSGVSSFQSFCVGTASRVGTGNLVGVVSAISVGGPGAIFWMWLVAMLGAATAFAEATLSQLYNFKGENGELRGGSAHYIEKALKSKKTGIFFVFAAVLCFLGSAAICSNAIGEAFGNAFGINKITTTILLVVLVGGAIFGKASKVVRILEKLVPLMAIIYLIVTFYIVVKNIEMLPAILKLIFVSAFGVKQAIGGTFGAIIMTGVKRGLYSSEAGLGSATAVAASTNVSHPIKQGLIQALGVFIDTLVICTATAMIVLLADQNLIQNLSGMTLLQEAMKYHFGNFGIIFIALILFLFGFSTILGTCYYSKINLSYINDKKTLVFGYNILVVLIIIFGGLNESSVVWSLSDLGLGLMGLINITAIFILRKECIDSLDDYELNVLTKKELITD